MCFNSEPVTTHRSRHIVAMPLNDFLTDASLEMLPVDLGVLKMRNVESWERGVLDAFKSWKNCGVIIDHVIIIGRRPDLHFFRGT